MRLNKELCMKMNETEPWTAYMNDEWELIHFTCIEGRVTLDNMLFVLMSWIFITLDKKAH